MMHPLRTTWLAGLVLSTLSSTTAAQTTIETSYDLDVRDAMDDAGKLGVDFNVELSASRTQGPDPEGHHFRLGVTLSGSQDFRKSTQDLDQMVGEVRLAGEVYSSSIRESIPPRKVARYLELLDVESPTPEQAAETEELTQYILGTRRGIYASYDAHYRVEANQEWTEVQHAFGVGVSATLPLLDSFLDLPAEATRVDEPRFFSTKPVRAYVGMDYVAADDALTTLEEESGVDGYVRLRGEAAWSTLVFDNQVLRVSWRGELILDPPARLDEIDREFNSFIEVSFIVPVSGKAGVLVKYVDGRLSPSYEEIAKAVVGLNVTS